MELFDPSKYFAFSREFFISLGIPGLFIVSFLEFFLLPIPPDLVLIPLAVARPELAFLYATIATAGSVTAGLVGYLIGQKGGRIALESRFSSNQITQIEEYFNRYGFATIGVGAIAPIPEGYEILSISAGVFRLNFRSYLFASLLGRGGRYFLEALLVLTLGEAAQSVSEIQLYILMGIVTLLVLLVYFLRR